VSNRSGDHKPRLGEDDLETLLKAAEDDCVGHRETSVKLGWSRQRVSRLATKYGAVSTIQDIYARNKALREGTSLPPKVDYESVQNLVQKNTDPPPPQIVGAGPDVRPNIDEIRRTAEARFEMAARRAQDKQHQSIRWPHGPIAIFFLGDQHIGNKGADVKRMYDEQKMIMETPGSYVWQMGDVVDNFIVGRLVAENFKETLPIWDQWELAKDYLHGFGNRLVAVNGGNHDFWHQKVSGIDYTRDISPSGVLYDADTIRATLHVGPHAFRVWTRHKWKGKSMYNPTHGQERGAREDDPDRDIYVGAHNHTGAVCREFIRKAERKLAIQIGTYKMVDDYAVSEGFPRHDSSTACGVVMHDDGSFFAAADIRAILNYQRAVFGR
jgi:hypothetical protein